MAVNASQVLIGSPDQATTGAILSAPLGTTLPTSATDTLDEAFVDSGFVSEDGLTLAPGVSTADVREWGGSLVRRILQSFDGTLSWAMLETNEAALRAAFGDEYVNVVAASAAHGKQITARLGAHLPAAKSWVFRMKDGNNRIMIVVPNGQITTVNDISFTSSDAIAWSVELSCYPDATGESIYVMTDDGAIVEPGPGPSWEPALTINSTPLESGDSYLMQEGETELTILVSGSGVDENDQNFMYILGDGDSVALEWVSSPGTGTGWSATFDATSISEPTALVVNGDDAGTGATVSFSVTIQPAA